MPRYYAFNSGSSWYEETNHIHQSKILSQFKFVSLLYFDSSPLVYADDYLILQVELKRGFHRLNDVIIHNSHYITMTDTAKYFAGFMPDYMTAPYENIIIGISTMRQTDFSYAALQEYYNNITSNMDVTFLYPSIYTQSYPGSIPSLPPSSYTLNEFQTISFNKKFYLDKDSFLTIFLFKFLRYGAIYDISDYENYLLNLFHAGAGMFVESIYMNTNVSVNIDYMDAKNLKIKR